MTFAHSFNQAIKDHSTKSIVGASVTLLLVVGLILAIVCVIKHRNKKTNKRTNCKNTIELNEE